LTIWSLEGSSHSKRQGARMKAITISLKAKSETLQRLTSSLSSSSIFTTTHAILYYLTLCSPCSRILTSALFLEHLSHFPSVTPAPSAPQILWMADSITQSGSGALLNCEG
jgi:hypothetical protein